MPGSTPNSNILDAIDELIKAINDLGNRPVSVQVSGGCGCCGGGGYAPPLPPGTDPTEGVTPPEGYTPYTNVDVTACKKAAFVYFGTREVLTELQKYEDTIQLGFDTALIVISAVLGKMGPVGALIVAKYSGAVDLLTDWLDTSVDMQTLTQIWTENQDALICALYNAASEGSGASYTSTLGEINGILSDGGASTGNLGVISSILTVETLTILWYNPTFRDVTIEQQIADYVLPEGVDCSGCGEAIVQILEYGGSLATLIDGNLSNSGTFQSEVGGVFGFEHREMIYLTALPGGENRLYSFNLISSGDTSFFLSYLDTNGNSQAVGWSGNLPSSIEARTIHIVGGSNYPSTPIVVEISYEIL
jgi:hypothetical protein